MAFFIRLIEDCYKNRFSGLMEMDLRKLSILVLNSQMTLAIGISEGLLEEKMLCRTGRTQQLIKMCKQCYFL